MSNQTADRPCPNILPDVDEAPVAASEKFFFGSAVFKDEATGYAKRPALPTDVPLGVCELAVDNTAGAAGAKTVRWRKYGAHSFKSGTSGDALTFVDINQLVYSIDDQTVGKTDGGGTRPALGILRKIEGAQFFVEIGAGIAAGQDVLTLEAVPVGINDLTGASALTYAVTMPFDGSIEAFYTTVEKVIATANATLTTSIVKAGVATAVTGGVITIPIAAIAIGTQVVTTPSAAKTFAKGDDVRFLVGGGDTGAGRARVTILARKAAA